MRAKPLKKLGEQHKLFVLEYLKDHNASGAAVRAGYSERTAGQKGHDLLKDPLIIEHLAEQTQARNKRVEKDADYVLEQIVAIHEMDLADILNADGSVKPIQDWPQIWRRMVSAVDLAEMFEGRGDERQMVGVLKKIKWPDKVKNLELMGKHVNVQAFKEKIEHEGTIENLTPVVNINLTK